MKTSAVSYIGLEGLGVPDERNFQTSEVTIVQQQRFATLPDPMKRLLLALLADRSGSLYGYQLMAETGLPSGTLYPMLSRLMHDGWIAISREEIDPHLEGRPARTFCRLTGDGAELANEWVLESSARANSKRAADA